GSFGLTALVKAFISAAVLPHPQREQIGPAGAGHLLWQMESEAVAAVGEEMRFHWRPNFAAGLGPEQTVLRQDEAVIHRGSDEARGRILGHVKRRRAPGNELG